MHRRCWRRFRQDEPPTTRGPVVPWQRKSWSGEVALGLNILASAWRPLRGLRQQRHNVRWKHGAALSRLVLRMRALRPTLRQSNGGLRDVEAPLEELAALALSSSAVLVVENQETGIALPGMPRAAVFMRLCGAVAAWSAIRWLDGLRTVYWGDVDTHGLAILSRARRALPQTVSVLMDAATLERYAELAGQEPSQHGEAEFPELTPAEREVLMAFGPGAGEHESAWSRNGFLGPMPCGRWSMR